MRYETSRSVLPVPRAKRPQLFSLAASLRTEGDFNDFGARVTAEGAVRTLTGTSAQAALFGLRILTEKPSPVDGSDICQCDA